MTRMISQRELRNDNAAIMRELEEGHGFIVTRHGQPIAELTPLRRHRFVSKTAVVANFTNAPRINLQKLREDLDALGSQEIAPRG
jgi:antitoxin (DNA-binding transcriptional repressor) of toxin-antitoxin stability system